MDLKSLIFKDQFKKEETQIDAMLDKIKLAIGLVMRLRAPEGCPWDRTQNHLTLRPYLIEEAYEALEILDRYQVTSPSINLTAEKPNPEKWAPADGFFSKTDQTLLKEELGDVFLQVLLHAQLCSERQEFDMGDIALFMTEKLVSRHPHVFGEDKLTTAGEVLQNWEQIKKKEKEKKGQSQNLSVPSTLPSLQRAQRISDKAGRLGFDWKDKRDVFKKVEEEFFELKEALESNDPKEIEHEIGDLFFATCNLARWQNLQAEDTHRRAIERFEARFAKVEEWFREHRKDMSRAPLAELDTAWDWAKAELKKTKNPGTQPQ